MLSGHDLTIGYSDRVVGARSRRRARQGRGAGAARAERRRQDHAAQDAARPAGAAGRRGAARRTGRSPRYASRERARLIAYVPQVAHRRPSRSRSRAVVLMGRTAHGSLFSRADRRTTAPSPRARWSGSASRILRERPYTMISGGERQLVLLARALAQEPQFIVLDEPTASLDFGNQGKVMREIRALAASGHGVLFTTHDPNHAHARRRPRLSVARGRAHRRRCGRRGAQPRATRGALWRAGRDRSTRHGGARKTRVSLPGIVTTESGMRRRSKSMSAPGAVAEATRVQPSSAPAVHCDRREPAHKVELAFNPSARYRERFVKGEKTDVIILSFPAIEALEKEGRSPPAAAPISAARLRRRGARRHDDARTFPRSKAQADADNARLDRRQRSGARRHRPASISPICSSAWASTTRSSRSCAAARPAARCALALVATAGRDRHHLHQRIHCRTRAHGGRAAAARDRLCEWLCWRRSRQHEPQCRAARAFLTYPRPRPVARGDLQGHRIGLDRLGTIYGAYAAAVALHYRPMAQDRRTISSSPIRTIRG